MVGRFLISYEQIKNGRSIPVIFLTARSDGLATSAGAMIADDYIEKPIEINELKTRIDNVLNKVKKKK